ncbi:MAG: AAA family ATPase [Phycisphaerales bacterium]|nr:AAA family ATPase [Phycisphaerales bacterium]
MIKRVHVHYFKRFKDEDFDLTDHVVLAGPNNSGKTTLLQAIVVWSLAVQKWRERRGPESGSKATERSGVALARQDFTAMPLRLMDHLWTDTITGLQREERPAGQKPGQPRVLEITLVGTNGGNEWNLGFEFRYSNSELLYVKPIQAEIPESADKLSVVYVPPFSGIGHAETRHDRPYQDLLIGQGKAGDILRNLLFEVHGHPDASKWTELCRRVEELFRVKLEKPEYSGTPHIVCEYTRQDTKAGKGRARLHLDIASAGSGFHQVLLLLGFFYARPATVLLLDEPDAHLHVILQKQIYDMLRRVATRQNCQLLIATHSEVLIDNTAPTQILSFYGEPHRLAVNTERDQVREALKRLSAMDILLTEKSLGVIYVEDQTDADLVAAWAHLLGHPMAEWFDTHRFVHLMHGRRPKEAQGHFFALKSVNPSVHGFLLLDGDNRNEMDHELKSDGLTIGRWKRYEAESYLLHPDALRRFLLKRVWPPDAEGADEFLREQLPLVVYKSPMDDHDYLSAIPASKTLLPDYFRRANLDLPKSEYYLIAEAMRPDEIPPEVKEKLDAMARTLGVGG